MDRRLTVKHALFPRRGLEGEALDGSLTESLNRAAVPRYATLPTGLRTLPYILFSYSVSLAGYKTGNATFSRDEITGFAIWKSCQGLSAAIRPSGFTKGAARAHQLKPSPKTPKLEAELDWRYPGETARPSVSGSSHVWLHSQSTGVQKRP